MSVLWEVWGAGGSRVGLSEPGASRPPWRWQGEWAGDGGPARFLVEQLEQLVVSTPELGQSWRSASQNGGERARPGRGSCSDPAPQPTSAPRPGDQRMAGPSAGSPPVLTFTQA